MYERPLTRPSDTLSPRGEGLLSFCREAIYLIAYNEKENGKKVMLPKYTCDTVVAPFQQLGYDYQFYPVCKDLTIDIPKAKEIFSVHHPNLIVVSDDRYSKGKGDLFCSSSKSHCRSSIFWYGSNKTRVGYA